MMPFHLFMSISMKCTVLRVNVPYFYTSVPGKVDRMLAGACMHSKNEFYSNNVMNVIILHFTLFGNNVIRNTS